MKPQLPKIFLYLSLALLLVGLSLLVYVKITQAQASGTTGMVVYGSTGDSSPNYQLWDGASFGAEQNAQDTTTGINWVLMQGIPRLRNEKIMGTIAGGSKTLYIQRWNGSSWTTEWTRNLISAVNRNFSIAYEQFTGYAIVVYGDNTAQLKYRKWNGSSWTEELNAGSPLDSTPYFIQTAARSPYVNSRRNDIMTMVTTSGGKLHALRWNNGVWENQVQMTNDPASVTSDVAGVVYERTSGDAMMIWGAADNKIVYRRFITSWQDETVAYSGLTGTPAWIEAATDRLYGSNRISVIWNASDNYIQFGLWNGSSWETMPTAVETGNIDKRNVSTAWEKHTGKVLFAFSKKTPNGKALSWRSWTQASGFSAVTQESGELGQNIRWIRLKTDAKSNGIMGMFLDIGGDLSSRRWNGTNWGSGFTNVAVGLSSATTEPFDFFWDDTAPSFIQNGYRWYADNDQIKPTDPWSPNRADFINDLAENTPIALADLPPASSETLRLRISTRITINYYVAGEDAFRLQFAQKTSTCSAIPSETWADVGALDSGSSWRGYGGTPADGTVLSTDPPTSGDLLLSGSDRAGTYEEENPSALNPYYVAMAEDLEYDWLIQDNGALPETTYCFRIVNLEGLEDTYNIYPEVTTAGYRAQSQNWRWYDDETNETPSSALAAENVEPTDVVNQNIVKLRTTVSDTASVPGTDIKFKLQFSPYEDFSDDVTDVVGSGSCGVKSFWCYANGVDADDDAITTRVLTDSNTDGRHNESGTTASTFDAGAASSVETEFTIKHAGARAGATYYFRLYNATKDISVLTNTGEAYPNLTTEEGTLSFTVSGLAADTSTEGIVTDTATTATTIPFGVISPDVVKEAAQRLQISTNATDGYHIYISEIHSLKRADGTEIAAVTGTNASPSIWSTGCAGNAAGCLGYHSGDDSLEDGSARFSANDTWAKLETISKRVGYQSNFVSNEIIDLVFKIKITGLQPAGDYFSPITYVVVPAF